MKFGARSGTASGAPAVSPWEKTFLALCWSALTFLVFRRLITKMTDTDLWWHLAAGRFIIENGTFLRADVFSHTLYGTPWVNFEWLGQVFAYELMKHGGPAFLFSTKIILGAAAMAAVVQLLRVHGGRGTILFVASAFTFLALRPRLSERIELATLLALPIFLLCLSRPRSFPREMFWLTAGFALWANIHAGCVYGLGAAALMTVGAFWSGDPFEGRRLGKLTVLFALAMFATPNGIGILSVLAAHIRQLLFSPPVISEWKPTSVSDNPAFWTLFVLGAAFLTDGLLRRDSTTRFWAPAVTVFSLWGALFYRNASIAALVIAPFIIARLSALARERPAFPTERAAAALALITLLSQASHFNVPKLDGVLRQQTLPVGASHFLHAHPPAGRMFNSYEFGGYLEWDLNESKLVFMDGRYIFHALISDQMERLQRAATRPADGAWPTYWDHYDVGYAVVSYINPVVSPPSNGTPTRTATDVMFPSSEWALVYWDDSAVVLARRRSENEEIIRRFEYIALQPYNLDQMKNALTSGALSAAQVDAELARHSAEAFAPVLEAQMRSLLKPGVQ